MKKSPLSCSIVAPIGWEDATKEWNERVQSDAGSSDTTVKQKRTRRTRTSVPSSELAVDLEEGHGRHTVHSRPALAALVHPSAPIRQGSSLPHHRGATKSSISLAKTLATKALSNAHRRGANRIDAMNSHEDPPYAVAIQHQQQVNTAPYAETVTDGVLSRSRDTPEPVIVTMQDGSQTWSKSPLFASNNPQQLHLRMPKLVLQLINPDQRMPVQIVMPEPAIPSSVQQNPPISMPEPQIPKTALSPQILKMPEPHLDHLQSPPVSIPLQAVPQAATMSMPEPSLPVRSNETPEMMPEPQVPSIAFLNSIPAPTSYTNTQPLAPREALVPDSTYDPASLQPPQWTDTRTPARTLAEDDEILLGRMKSALEHLPPSLRAGLPKEDLIRMVMEAVETEQNMNRDAIDLPQAHVQDAYWPHCVYPHAYPYAYPASLVGQEVYEVPARQTWPAAEYVSMEETPLVSANDWFQMNGGGVLPVGWTAQFDYSSGKWYYINLNVTPPTTTWQDPRLSLSASAPLPAIVPISAPLPPSTFAYPPPPTHEEVEYLASQFGALQAHRQYRQDAPGPVTAELSFERKQAKEIAETIESTQLAQQKANEAAVNGRAEEFRIAQEEMVRARGKLDRITYESRLRSAKTTAMIPPSLQYYQGVTRGFDVDPAYLKLRTLYTDARVLPPQPILHPHLDVNGTTSFSGRVMGKFIKQRLPNNMYMPTAYPLPPGVKYKASTTTPTPYSIPEFCFAWDMLLRNRKSPTNIATTTYPY